MDELISVIVPVYNIKEYLERCVASILAQTYRNLEVLLVDDGSTDGTSELVDELAKRDSRIRVFHKKNGGSSSARNLGIEHARGTYYGFVDSDDYIEPFMYERLLRAIKDSGLPIAQGGREEIDENGSVLPDICIPPERELHYDSETFMRELLLHKGDCSFCTKLTLASLFEEDRFPVGVLNEDFHVLVKLLPRIEGIASVPERVYHVFYKSGSNTRVKDPNAFSRVYGDNVDNADMVSELVWKHFPELSSTAMRFGLYQRLDYLLHIPIGRMSADNDQYIGIVRYLRSHRAEIRGAQALSQKEKLYLLLLSAAPKTVRRGHRLLMRMRGAL